MKYSFLPKIQSIFWRLRSISSNEPLSWLSIVIIIFLDIFVLFALFQGLSDQTSSFTTPSDVIPYDCRAIAIDTENYDKDQKITGILSRVKSYQYEAPYNSYEYPPSAWKHKEDLDPTCAQIETYFEKIRTDSGFIQILDAHEQIMNRISTIEGNISRLGGTYDTILLEKIANQPREDSIKETTAQSIKADMREQTENLNKALDEKKANMLKIEQNTNIQNILLSLTPAVSKDLKKTISKLEFYYPLKRLWVELLFLIPLFLIVLFWNNRSIRHDNWAQSLVSSHLLVVIFIPIFSKICEGIFEIIPKQLLQKLMKFLQDMQIFMLWYYFLILLAIGIALASIYFVQKKIFNKKRLTEKHVEHSDCQYCGRHLRIDDIYCPFCGANQLRKCHQCHEDTYRELSICRKCGKE